MAVVAVLTFFALVSCKHPSVPSSEGTVLLKTIRDVAGFSENADGSMPVGYDVRYAVQAYALGGDGLPDVSAVSWRHIFSSDDASCLDTDVSFSLPTGSYRLVVWADFVPAGTGADCFWNTSDFRRISPVRSVWNGCSDLADSFVGAADVEVTSQHIEDNPAEISIMLSQPVAKVRFVASDLKLFLERVRDLYGPDADVAGYRVRVSYPDGLHGYDAVAGKAVAECDAFSFTSVPYVLNEDDAMLAYDLTVVPENGKVAVEVEVLNADGAELSATGRLEIPVECGRTTTVKGNFLTLMFSDGIWIKTGFDTTHDFII